MMDDREVLIEPGEDGEPVATFSHATEMNNSILSQSIINDTESDQGEPSSTSTPRICRSLHQINSMIEPDTTPLVPNNGSNQRSEFVGEESEVSYGGSYPADCLPEGENGEEDLVKHVLIGGPSRESLMVPGALRVPIIGYETMESRSKFTIYKIHVMMSEDDTGWFIFRRYSDFCTLNDQLRILFPNVRLALPPKRWFRSNFDPLFLEERQVGLQDFLEMVTGHRDICNSQPVRDFFCFDDPPSASDSLEESRAQCECLEEMLYLLRKELAEKEIEMDLMKEEIDLYKTQVRLLTDRLSEYNKAFAQQEKASLERANSVHSSTSSLKRSTSALERTSNPSLKVSNNDLRKSASDLEKDSKELSEIPLSRTMSVTGSSSSKEDLEMPRSDKIEAPAGLSSGSSSCHGSNTALDEGNTDSGENKMNSSNTIDVSETRMEEKLLKNNLPESTRLARQDAEEEH